MALKFGLQLAFVAELRSVEAEIDYLNVMRLDAEIRIHSKSEPNSRNGHWIHYKIIEPNSLKLIWSSEFIPFQFSEPNRLKLLQGERARTPTQVVVDDILTLSRNFDFCTFVHASRSCNKVDHFITNLALSVDELSVWMEDYPNELASIVLFDKVVIW